MSGEVFFCPKTIDNKVQNIIASKNLALQSWGVKTTQKYHNYLVRGALTFRIHTFKRFNLTFFCTKNVIIRGTCLKPHKFMHLASKSIHTLIYWRFVTSCNLYVQPPHSHTLFKNEWICALYCNYPTYKPRYLLWKFILISSTYHELHIITPFLIQFSSLCLSLCLGFMWLEFCYIYAAFQICLSGEGSTTVLGKGGENGGSWLDPKACSVKRSCKTEMSKCWLQSVII